MASVTIFMISNSELMWTEITWFVVPSKVWKWLKSSLKADFAWQFLESNSNNRTEFFPLKLQFNCIKSYHYRRFDSQRKIVLLEYLLGVSPFGNVANEFNQMLQCIFIQWSAIKISVLVYEWILIVPNQITEYDAAPALCISKNCAHDCPEAGGHIHLKSGSFCMSGRKSELSNFKFLNYSIAIF